MKALALLYNSQYISCIMNYFYIALLFFTPLLPSEQASTAPAVLTRPSIKLSTIRLYVPTSEKESYTEDLELHMRSLVYEQGSDINYKATELLIVGKPHIISQIAVLYPDLKEKRDYSKSCFSECLKWLCSEQRSPQHESLAEPLISGPTEQKI